MKPPISPADPPALVLELLKSKFWTTCLGGESVARLLRPSSLDPRRMFRSSAIMVVRALIRRRSKSYTQARAKRIPILTESRLRMLRGSLLSHLNVTEHSWMHPDAFCLMGTLLPAGFCAPINLRSDLKRNQPNRFIAEN